LIGQDLGGNYLWYHCELHGLPSYVKFWWLSILA